MNGKEFSLAYAKENKIAKDKAAKICKSVFRFLSKAISNEDFVYICGLGTFKKGMTSKRVIGDVNNGGLKTVEPRQKIIFRQTKTFFDKEKKYKFMTKDESE